MPTWIGSSGSKGGGRGSGGQFEAEAAASASNGFGGTILKRGRSSGSSECRTIPPETVHGASVTLANFENLGKPSILQYYLSILCNGCGGVYYILEEADVGIDRTSALL